MANPITYLGSPVNITPTDDGTWRTVDLSAHIPSGASGVLLRSRFSAASSSDNVGFRKTGSTDTLVAPHLASPVYVYTMVGVNGSRQLDILIENGGAGAGTVELLAYFDPGSVKFFDNCVLLDTVSQSTWIDLDITAAVDTISAGDTAIAAILYLHSSRANPTEVGWRKNGSSEDIRADHPGNTGGRYIGCVIVPVDAGEIFEGWRASSAYGDFKLIGYVKANYTALDPGVDVSLGSTGAWTDITQAGALAQMIDTVATAVDLQRGFRKNGDSSTVGYGALEFGERLPALVECDASGIIEGQIDNVAVDFYRRGYFTAAAPSVGLIHFTGANNFVGNNGAPVASQALTFYIWRAARPPGTGGAPDQILTGTTDTNGEITLEINPGALDDGDPAFVLAFAAIGTQRNWCGEVAVEVVE